MGLRKIMKPKNLSLKGSNKWEPSMNQLNIGINLNKEILAMLKSVNLGKSKFGHNFSSLHQLYIGMVERVVNLEGSDSTIQSIAASFGYDHQDNTVWPPNFLTLNELNRKTELILFMGQAYNKKWDL